MSCNSTASVYNILSDTVTAKQTVSTLPEGYAEKSYCADLHLSRSGKKIYGSNRGHNSIVTFRVGADGKLSEPITPELRGQLAAKLRRVILRQIFPGG